MKILIVFLGTGASGGTPGSGKSKRLESSVFIRNGLNILIDVTRNFPRQVEKIKKIDAVFLTHGHMDACGGIGKLSSDTPVFAHPQTLKVVTKKFKVSHLKLTPVKTGQHIKLKSWDMIPCQIPHSRDPKFPTFAWKLQSAKTIVYASDMAYLTPKFKRFCSGADYLIVDGATWKRKIFTHLRIDQDLPTICRWPVGKIIFTQIGKSVPPHGQLTKTVRKICLKATPAYDGMTLSI